MNTLEHDARERMNERLSAGRRYPVINILGTESTKALLDYAAAAEGIRTQDLIRKYLLLPLEEKFGDQVPAS